ncbi:MAG: 4'-phosphopantetheinyl transferase superfamily protein [Ruminococcus sp.]|jgi:phosphopantetheine--protein transferase-like protein|nr:4'-phosphopantetheinyl transferase superfamily protein [Ruminococcus sp.]
MNIGIHTIDYKHFRKLAVNPRFRSKLLTSREMKFLMGKGFSTRIIAEMFCVKNAFIKAMGGAVSGCRMDEISVLQDWSGLAYIAAQGMTKTRLDAKKCKITCSFSHNNRTATAVVVLYPANM